jgi:integrase
VNRRRQRSRQRGLYPGERTRLLGRASRAPRTHLVYALALELGLGCREIALLDVGDVSDDGRTARESLLLRAKDGRVRRAEPPPPAQFPAELREEVARHLERRRSRCEHHVRPMRTIIGSDRRPRCASCGEDADFRRAPLFVNRQGGRISERYLRKELARLRDRLRLNPAIRFGSLRATYFADHAGGSR